MDVEQIEQLASAFEDSNQGNVYWRQKGSKNMLRVESINSTSCRNPMIKLESKDWLYLKDMNYADFFLVRPVSDLFE